MPKKKRTKLVILPWCWYCEREFEDEKVLMQHQKAKHYKCRHCPRKLNTAGGLAVHVQQVHKLDPEKIDNAMPGRDGGEVEIFGMEGIPKDDLEAWRRKKEQEAGLAVGSTSQPPQKRPKLDKRPISEHDLAAQLAAHKALMGGDLNKPMGLSGPTATGAPTVYGAPQTYNAPPPGAMLPPGAPGALPFPGGMPPFPGPPPMGALPPGAPVPPFPPFPPGMLPPPGFPAGGIPPFPPPGLLPPGAPPFALGPNGVPMPPPGMTFPPGPLPPGMLPPPGAALPPPGAAFGGATPGPPLSTTPAPPAPAPAPAALPITTPKIAPKLPEVKLPMTNNLKGGLILLWEDPNYLPDERRSQDPKYAYVDAELPIEVEGQTPAAGSAEARGTKRARAEDFL